MAETLVHQRFPVMPFCDFSVFAAVDDDDDDGFRRLFGILFDPRGDAPDAIVDRLV